MTTKKCSVVGYAELESFLTELKYLNGKGREKELLAVLWVWAEDTEREGTEHVEIKFSEDEIHIRRVK